MTALSTRLYRIAANAAKNHLVAQGRRPSSDMALDDSESLEIPVRLRDNESPDEVIMGSAGIFDFSDHRRVAVGVEGGANVERV